ncbi:hypothetical protein ED28_16530 [[Pantoea] beijingensis]|uniref:Pili assembly chaperone N-terminal domain-containing protein n=1 Tax=[Pantoea] beijingensis TaxID=1324864 RepID=A0A443IAD6_9GAMM|nr:MULTISPECIES: fimbria/pilus periplasmic chaperone [Erwiniaceae]RWR01054.1 hypothetical protein ED28_16530 [[Pantoea] beijingensis]
MIKRLLILFFLFYANNASCGISVVGTRFMINSEMSHLNIKVVNDNESDYLIKSTLDDNDYFVSPPLFLQKKNTSNLITILPKEKKQYDEDKIINLTITAIPRSSANNDVDSISMAVRSHFKIIYRHKELHNIPLDKIKLVNENDRCSIVNNSDFVLTLSLSVKKNDFKSRLFNISPYSKTQLDNEKLDSSCNAWVSFYNEDNDIIETVNISRKQ